MENCTRCKAAQAEDEMILAELAHSENRGIRSLFQQLRDGRKSALRERVVEHVRERLSEEDLGEQVEVPGDYERTITNKMLPKDVEECLECCIQQGTIEVEKGQIRITPKGGRKLANRIKIKLEDLPKRKTGTHKIKDLDYGLDLATSSKKYEIGDAYQAINIPKTLIHSLERNAIEDNHSRISLQQQDIHVYERTFDTRMCLALVIDESGSMGEDKRNAAIDACLALAKFKKTNDKLKVFVYSAEVKEIPVWEVLNISLPGGTTDMRIALQAARISLKQEKGDKQIYLITDTEPNTENGRYVGFEAAMPGVKREVWRCRREDVTLNIVMLDERAKTQELASQLAKINAGRVFFASPSNLGKVMIEDYLSARKSIGATR